MALIRQWFFRLHTLRLTLLLFVVGCASHQPATTAPKATAVAPNAPERALPATPKKLFFWRLRNETSTVYLLGSVHVASPELYPLDTQIEQAFQGAQTLSLEVVMDDRAQAEAAKKLALAARYPNGDTLKHHVSAETLAAIEPQLRTLGLPAPALEHFRPWFVAMTLTMAELERLGFDSSLGIDEHFRKEAGTEKRLLSIETVDDQIGLFASLSDQGQEDELKQTLEELDTIGPEMLSAIDLWKQGDTAGVDRLLLEPMRQQYPDLFRELFLERDVKMANAVEKLLGESGVHFVIVGAGHLVGNQGVIDLLKQHGHPIEQLEQTQTPH